MRDGVGARIGSHVDVVGAVDACISRLDGDRWGAVVHRRDGDARLEAAEIARRVARGGPAGALAGLCFTVKAVLQTGVLPSTAASLLVDEDPRPAAPVVERISAADAVLVGVTNCAEFALAPVATSRRYGTTTNPVAPGRTPGGSSAGCAAAVAGGLVPFSVGTDYGGSVRFPAACTGIYGFRPAAGSVPAFGQVPSPPPGSPRARFSTPGVLAGDVATLTSVVAVLLGQRVTPRRAVTIGWVDTDGSMPVDRETRRGVRFAADVLGARPARDFGGNPLVGADDAFGRIRATDTLEPLPGMADGRLDRLSPPMRDLLAAEVIPADPWAEADARALQVGADAFFEDCQLLIAPVATTVAPPVDTETSFAMLAPCRAVSLLGCASLAVPVGMTHDGVPIGVQLIGRVAELLWAAGELEPHRFAGS
jgi:amidase